MSNFRIGEKVVCVNPINELVKNNIYTISNIINIRGDIGVHVEEIAPVPSGISNGFLWYNINRFRKLDHQFGEGVCAEILKKVKEESLISVN